MNFKRNCMSCSFLIYFLSAFICESQSSALSYREDVIEDSTTPRIYNDQFKIKKQYKTISPNFTSFEYRNIYYKPGYQHRPQSKDEKDGYKVKSVLPGEKTIKPCEEDENVDEYGEEGPQEKPQDETNKQEANMCDGKQNNPVPMMIIHKLDMLAMQIPMNDIKKDQDKKKEGKIEENDGKKKEEKQWSEWSPCSRRCGDGLQSRWRYKTGVSGDIEREQQLKPCHLADCVPRKEFQQFMRPVSGREIGY